MIPKETDDKYFTLLKANLHKRAERYLLEAADHGRELLGTDVPTEEIAELHEEVLKRLAEKYPDVETLGTIRRASAPLMEILMAYGLTFREQLEQRKRAEKVLVQERHLLQALIYNIPDSIYFKDDKNRFIRVNKAKAEHSGTTPENMIGKTDFDFFPKEQAKEAFADDKRVMKSNRPLVDKVEKVTHADGTKHWVSVTKIPRHNEKGEVIGTMGISRDITERKRTEKELQQSFEKLRKILQGTINTLASTVEMRDPYTAGHQRRVTQLACAIVKKIGLSEEQIHGLHFAATIHDIGKINVPFEILSKPGRISEAEFSIIKTHPQVGHDTLRAIEFPWPIAPMILQHHERIDGSGYPSGLSGEDILPEARILGVADVVEAMASHRPYRPALGIDKALEEISKNRGTLYDPRVVDACLKLFTEKGFSFQ